MKPEPGTYPPHPTRGWLYAELERLGVSVRGRPLSDEQLCRMLRARGYEVSAEPAPKKEQEER